MRPLTALITVGLIAGCAIKPPAESVEPLRWWAKPSVQRDCNCDGYPGSFHDECVARCERSSDLIGFRCSNYIRRSPPDRSVVRATAITIGIAGTVLTALIGFGYVTPHR